METHFNNEGLAATEGDAFREQLQRVVADRHAPEAAAVYRVIFDYAKRRVQRSGSRAKLSTAEQEEIVGDVLLSMMRGGLASFRGGSVPELMGFVRTIVDRSVWRRMRQEQRERVAVEGADATDIAACMGPAPGSNDRVEFEVVSPLDATDQEYLIQLLRSGTKAEHARNTGVSRAAVTQRVKRILQRLDEFDVPQKAAHDVWMSHQATIALSLEE